jgi:hypothetical protein
MRGMHVEEQGEVPDEDGGYDEKCERPDVAIRAIWELYRRDRWELLGEVGLPRAAFYERFRKFDEEHITSESGKLHRNSQVVAFLQAVPEVLRVAIAMNGMYQGMYSKQRRKRK